MPKDLNWWIAVIFAFGSALFAAGSVQAIGASLGRLQSPDPNLIRSLDPNLIFFAGSIPFTTAAYLQLFQAANAGDPAEPDRPVPKPRAVFGWKQLEIGWLSCALPNVQSALAEMDQAIEQTRQSRILSGQKLEAPFRILELANRYHATAGALQNCGRLIQTLEIQRCWVPLRCRHRAAGHPQAKG